MPRRPKNPRAGVPLPAPYARLIDRDAQFGHRMRAWREEQGVTQDRLRELLEQHTDYQPESTTSVSRLELGKAWPNLWVVEAMARLDATVAGGGGRGLVYWGYGLTSDPYLSSRPGPVLAPDEIPEKRKTPLRSERRGAR